MGRGYLLLFLGEGEGWLGGWDFFFVGGGGCWLEGGVGGLGGGDADKNKNKKDTRRDAQTVRQEDQETK